MAIKKSTYLRNCRRCGLYYKTTARASKVCLDCSKQTGASYWKKRMPKSYKNLKINGRRK